MLYLVFMPLMSISLWFRTVLDAHHSCTRIHCNSPRSFPGNTSREVTMSNFLTTENWPL